MEVHQLETSQKTLALRSAAHDFHSLRPFYTFNQSTGRLRAPRTVDALNAFAALLLAMHPATGFHPHSLGVHAAVGSPVLVQRQRQHVNMHVTNSELHSLKVQDLKAELKSRGLKVSGSKAELIARLAEQVAIQDSLELSPTFEADEMAFEADDAGHSLEASPGPSAESVDKLDLASLTVKDLKARLKDLGQKVSGNKAELIARLEAHSATQNEIVKGESGAEQSVPVKQEQHHYEQTEEELLLWSSVWEKLDKAAASREDQR